MEAAGPEPCCIEHTAAASHVTRCPLVPKHAIKRMRMRHLFGSVSVPRQLTALSWDLGVEAMHCIQRDTEHFSRISPKHDDHMKNILLRCTRQITSRGICAANIKDRSLSGLGV